MHLILGTANFDRDYGKRLERDECFKILDRAKKLGIETVATAFDYGKDIVDEYGWKDVIHKYEPGLIKWGELDGITIDKFTNPIPFLIPNHLIMAPFNPLNTSFKNFVSSSCFIARSIFCGGRLQRSDKEDVARLIFGFLKSHEVKNAVFGVESIEELELIVRIANE